MIICVDNFVFKNKSLNKLHSDEFTIEDIVLLASKFTLTKSFDYVIQNILK